MWFAILGPLLVRDGDTLVDVPKGRQRVLLAALLLHAGKPVSADALAEMVWDQAPPPGAEVTLRSHVLRLRRVLGARLATRSPGYLLQAAEDEVDLLRFRCLCRDGAAAARASDWGRAHVLLGEALGLWRGAPLDGIPSESLRQHQTHDLELLRLQAEEWRTDAALQLGSHAELVPGLHSLTAQHPLRERFHGQLMLALYRCGRQAEALAAYSRARDILITELGAEPGPGLRELHQQILSADPALTATPATGPGEAKPVRVTPRELPLAAPGFTGRSAELAALTRLLDRPGAQGGEAIVISAIGGTAGVGKTALAVQWAHQVAGRFPDGQLYVNLRGYDPAQPMPPADALASFLRALGVPGPDIPPEDDERAARYRSLLADKRMLVILDNAGSADQVRPLLPGSPACTVLVTSRDALAGLVAREGAARLDLDVLPLREAIALLRTLIGPRVDDDPEAAAELAGQCCRLPLALRVAAELAASRPDVPLATLAGELTGPHTRLDLLAADADPRTQVRTVLSWSYRHLSADTARAFRLLGLHLGLDFEPYAAAALTGTTVPQARQTLNVLARAHLLSPASAGRYCMHDLLRAYARELSDTLDTGQAQHVALTRLFDHYLYAAASAMDSLLPAARRRLPRIPVSATPFPPLADPPAARDWLDRERATLLATAAHTAAHGWPGHATQLAAILSRYLLNGGHLPEALLIFNHALDAARRTGDRTAEAAALKGIGNVDWLLSRVPRAASRHHQALALFRAVRDRAGEASALVSIGLGEMQTGRYEPGARHQQEAAAIYRDIGNRFGEARALANLGLARQRQGRYQEAAGYHWRVLDLSRETGDREGEAWGLTGLGIGDLRRGRYQHATRYLRQALALFRDTGHAGGQVEAEILTRIGEVHTGLGCYEQAAGTFEQALAISRTTGDPTMEADSLNGLGDLLSRTGDVEKARMHHAAALRRASAAGSPPEQARAHSGLARTYEASGDSRQARHHWQEALTRYTAIGAPEADEIRAWLARAGGGDANDH